MYYCLCGSRDGLQQRCKASTGVLCVGMVREGCAQSLTWCLLCLNAWAACCTGEVIGRVKDKWSCILVPKAMLRGYRGFLWACFHLGLCPSCWANFEIHDDMTRRKKAPSFTTSLLSFIPGDTTATGDVRWVFHAPSLRSGLNGGAGGQRGGEPGPGGCGGG